MKLTLKYVLYLIKYYISLKLCLIYTPLSCVTGN